MKILFASDIHGSAEAGGKVLAAVVAEKADMLVLCGDIYYHGPRNPLPDGYRPMDLAALLNAEKNIIRCVKGNCDAEVDAFISEFKFEDNILLENGAVSVFVTHGHVYDKNNPPPIPFDLMVYGHYHTGFIEKKDGKIFANPGSATLPKGGTPASYLVMDGEELRLMDFSGNIIAQIRI